MVELWFQDNNQTNFLSINKWDKFKFIDRIHSMRRIIIQSKRLFFAYVFKRMENQVHFNNSSLDIF